jgi:enoyl-CoA hydratase
MSSGRYKTINWKVKDQIGQIILNQPPTNYMDNKFFNELGDLVKNVIPNTGLNAILVSGKGRHFSSGADLNDLLTNLLEHVPKSVHGVQDPMPDFLLDNLDTFRFFKKLEFPVISVITGVCLGAAFELALNCHIRICAENSLLGLPESSFNLLPGLGGIQNVLMLTNPKKTFEIVLGGHNFTAQEAQEWQLVDKVLDRNEVFNYANQLARFIGPGYSSIRKKKYLLDFDKSLTPSGL